MRCIFANFVMVVMIFVGSNAGATPPVDIVMLIKGQSNPYWKVLAEGAQDAAKEMNVNFALHTVMGDQDAEQQLNLCETILLQPPKLLIFAAVNSVNLVPCLKKAAAKNVTLVDIDGSYTQDQAKELGLPIQFSVASNNYDLGKMAASYLAARTGKILVLEGLAGSGPGQLRIDGFKENLGKDKQIIASLPADWDRLKAANVTADIIAQHPDLTAVFAANDMMALGAVETLRAKSKKNIVVVGVDGVADAVASIKEGLMTASIAQLPYLMGYEAVKKSQAYLSDPKPVPYAQYVDAVVLDKKTLADKKNALMKYVR